MKNNETLQRNVQNAIKWEPLLRTSDIGVAVEDGIVTLTGIVDSYGKKAEAENAAKKIAGVKAVVEKIQVDFSDQEPITDAEIAKGVLSALKWNWQVPNNKISVTVEHGWVTLQGELGWNYQKDVAKNAIQNIFGVKGVVNQITVKSDPLDYIEKKAIENAFARNWSINNQDVHVKVSGNRVTLTGTVESLYQKEEAQRITWNAPGVWFVDNELFVQHDHLLVD